MKICGSAVWLMVIGSELLQAEPASKLSGALTTPEKPTYFSEAPLPQGWPQPGPYQQVVRKNYPASRVAVAGGTNQNSGFLTLFQHIRQQGIPMTAPVAMAVDQRSGATRDMAFLYQSREIGNPGAHNEKVTIKDLPPIRVVSYAWQGPDSSENLKIARASIDNKIRAEKLEITGYRLLGYNSPFMPASKRTFEFQALVDTKP